MNRALYKTSLRTVVVVIVSSGKYVTRGVLLRDQPGFD